MDFPLIMLQVVLNIAKLGKDCLVELPNAWSEIQGSQHRSAEAWTSKTHS